MSHYPLYVDRITLWIFQIPPLIPITPSFDSEELDFPESSPVLEFESYSELTSLSQRPDEWYHGDVNSLPLYFDMFESDQKDAFTRCKLDITSDLSNISLTPIFKPSSRQAPYGCLTDYRICEGRPVNIFGDSEFGPVMVYTGSGPTQGFGLSSDCDHSRAPSSVSIPLAEYSHFSSFCPASGRLVHTIRGCRPRGSDADIVIRDFL